MHSIVCFSISSCTNLIILPWLDWYVYDVLYYTTAPSHCPSLISISPQTYNLKFAKLNTNKQSDPYRHRYNIMNHTPQWLEGMFSCFDISCVEKLIFQWLIACFVKIKIKHQIIGQFYIIWAHIKVIVTLDYWKAFELIMSLQSKEKSCVREKFEQSSNSIYLVCD